MYLVLVSTALSALEVQFANNCAALNGQSRTISGVTYAVQAAFVYGTSCYALTLTPGMGWDDAFKFCYNLNPAMHLVFLSTQAEFAMLNTSVHHVGCLGREREITFIICKTLFTSIA
jgi:hypothetical protein